MSKKTIIGAREYVTIIGPKKQKKLLARIDTGATKCSIDKTLAKQLGLGPVVKYVKVKTAQGSVKRAVILARIKIAKRTFKVFFTLANRKHLKHAALVGRNVLKKGFLINPSKKLR